MSDIVNAILVGNKIKSLENTIKDLDIQNQKTQRYMLVLTIATCFLAIVQIFVAITPLFLVLKK